MGKLTIPPRPLLLFLIFLCLESTGCSLDSANSTTEVSSANSGSGLELGEEYVEYRKDGHGGSGGGSGGFFGGRSNGTSTTEYALLYLPNRIVDFLDIFRVDVGVGPAVGYVIRLTKYGQFGYRTFDPASVRIGLFGRTYPVMLEKTAEFGIGPTFSGSPQRAVTPAEVGLGADLFILGGYLGLSLDEAGDFLAGVAGFDPAGDDF